MRTLHPPSYVRIYIYLCAGTFAPGPYGGFSLAFAIRRVTFRPIKSIMLTERERESEKGGAGVTATATVTATEWWQTLNMTHK